MYKRGTIVLTPFPFTDLSDTKVRPAVLISNSKIGDDVTFLFITSQQKLLGKYLVPITPDDKNGLKTASKIIYSRIAILETKVILGEIGTISIDVQQKIDTQLQKILGL